MSDLFTKSPFESKTVVAATVTLVASALGIAGYTFTPEDQAVIIGLGTAIVTGIGAAVSIYGRIKATKFISR